MEKLQAITDVQRWTVTGCTKMNDYKPAFIDFPTK